MLVLWTGWTASTVADAQVSIFCLMLSALDSNWYSLCNTSLRELGLRFYQHSGQNLLCSGSSLDGGLPASGCLDLADGHGAERTQDVGVGVFGGVMQEQDSKAGVETGTEKILITRKPRKCSSQAVVQWTQGLLQAFWIPEWSWFWNWPNRKNLISVDKFLCPVIFSWPWNKLFYDRCVSDYCMWQTRCILFYSPDVQVNRKLPGPVWGHF